MDINTNQKLHKTGVLHPNHVDAVTFLVFVFDSSSVRKFDIALDRRQN